MKALSIKQPWASLIAHGIKDIENRTWKTHFRGRIYIHASAGKTNLNVMKILNDNKLLESISDEKYQFLLSDDTRSAIIGEVDIVDCVINHPSIWAEKMQTHTCENTGIQILNKNQKYIWNWVLANPVLYDKPIINVKGKLSFWEPDIDIVECIGCSKKFDSEFMQEDSVGEKYCKECEEILFPIIKKEYDEMVTKGEIEPEN